MYVFGSRLFKLGGGSRRKIYNADTTRTCCGLMTDGEGAGGAGWSSPRELSAVVYPRALERV